MCLKCGCYFSMSELHTHVEMCYGKMNEFLHICTCINCNVKCHSGGTIALYMGVLMHVKLVGLSMQRSKMCHM